MTRAFERKRRVQRIKTIIIEALPEDSDVDDILRALLELALEFEAHVHDSLNDTKELDD